MATPDGLFTPVADEGVRDPWVVDQFAENPMTFDVAEHHTLARGIEMPVIRELDHVEDGVIAGVPVRTYRPCARAAGTIVYFHGGGFCIGGIGLMDNVARELAHATGATVVSVEYRLAPEHPYPDGLDDCVAVTRAVLEGSGSDPVLVAGESAGGNLAAATALRLRDDSRDDGDDVDDRLAGQILIYPVVLIGGEGHQSRRAFIDFGMTQEMSDFFRSSYAAGRDLSADPYASPLSADDLTGLPPAFVVIGGCDYLRDEGREYATRLRDAGVETEGVCAAGQPHGFVNHGFPAAAPVLDQIGNWVRRQRSG